MSSETCICDGTGYVTVGCGSHTEVAGRREVPYHEVQHLGGTVARAKGYQTELSGGRSIRVEVADDGGFYYRITRLLDDGRLIVLTFALSREAAATMAGLTISCFNHVHAEDFQPAKEDV